MFHVFSVAVSALEYYMTIQTSQHRSFWVSVLQMMYNRLADLPDTHFQALGMDSRRSFANIIRSEEQPIVREAVFRFISRSIS